MRAYILTTSDNHGRVADLTYYPSMLPTPELFFGVTPDTYQVPDWWLKGHPALCKDDVPERVFCCGKSKELLLRQHKEKFPNEDMLLMEDDVIWTEDADEKYSQFIFDVPSDWKLLYLGGWHEFSCKGCTPLQIKPNILRCLNALGNEAVVIRADIIDEVIARLTQSPDNIYGHSDWQLVPIQRKYCCYSPIGFIAGQQSGWSNLFQKEREMGVRNDFMYEGMDRQTHVYGDPKRQAILETALDWVSEGRIEEYMAAHRYDTEITELQNYFDTVIAWIISIFDYTGKEMARVDWATLYRRFHQKSYSKDKVAERVEELMADTQVQDKKGIFEFILGGETDYKLLNVRVFDDRTKKAVYAKQTNEAKEKKVSNCPYCAISLDNNAKRIYKLDEMDADHVAAWTKGGATDISNCKMLCKTHNRAKGNR